MFGITLREQGESLLLLGTLTKIVGKMFRRKSDFSRDLGHMLTLPGRPSYY